MGESCSNFARFIMLGSGGIVMWTCRFFRETFEEVEDMSVLNVASLGFGTYLFVEFLFVCICLFLLLLLFRGKSLVVVEVDGPVNG